MTVVCACGWLSHFTVFSFSQLRGWVSLFFPFHPLMRTMSVLSSNDCLAFSLSDHWGTLESWQVSEKDYLTTLNDCDVFACVWLSHLAVLSFSQLRGWVPLFFSFHLIMRTMSVPSSNDCLAFSLSHHWGTLGTWQEVSKTTSRLLEWLWCVHVCGCHILLYFLSPNSEGESHCSFHFTQ